MEKPPRVGLKMLLRSGLAALLIVALCGAAVSVAVIREIEDTVDRFTQGGRTFAPIPEMTRAEAGGARTIMILGSDKRKGVDSDSPARADTILLVRADPDKDSIGVTSIPRDLSVEIPGVGRSKINFAYEKGKERLTVRTVKRLFEDATGEDFPIHNVMTVDYGGFRRGVDYIGGVYVDIDRDYFNDNSSGVDNYATIDIDPGYQMLKGRDALDYVRYRHGDNDLVRAARQQDFLRQAKNAGGLRELMSLGQRDRLARAFNRYFTVDNSFKDAGEVISMIKLALFLSQDQPKVNEVRFRVREARNPQVDSNLYASTGALRKIHRELMSTEGSATPRKSSAPTEADREFERVRKKRRRDPGPVEGLEDAGVEGENLAVLMDPKLDFPFYFPDARLVGSRYAGEPRRYRLRDETGKRHEAYRLVLQAPGIGEYYGIQGMTWESPPILDNHDEVRRRKGRRYKLYYDGAKVRLVAWQTNRGTYWVSNTLTLQLSPDQMLEIAASLRRLGR